MVNIKETQLANQGKKQVAAETLCKNICKLISSFHKQSTNNVNKKFLPDKMTINFNVFGPIMLHCVMGDANGSLIITIKAHK